MLLQDGSKVCGCIICICPSPATKHHTELIVALILCPALVELQGFGRGGKMILCPHHTALAIAFVLIEAH